MPMREYKPIEAKKVLSNKTLDELKKMFLNAFEHLEPIANLFLTFDNWVALKSSIFIEERTIIRVKNPDNRKKKDVISEFPKHLHEKLKQLKEDLNLTNEQLKAIKKELINLEKQKLDIEKQIEIIEKKAFDVVEQSNKEKLLKRFRDRYSAFNECLNPELKELDDAMKSEVKTLLSDLTRTNEEIKNSL